MFVKLQSSYKAIALVALVAALTRCGSTDDGPVEPSSGTDASADARSPVDARAPDSSEPVDGASSPDGSAASPDSSAGSGHDAGGSDAHADAGVEVDASVPDASSGVYDPCPTDGGICTILPLGDSITYGIQYAGAYRVELFSDAVKDHKNITFLGDPSLADGPATVDGVPFPPDNQGHSGWTIDQIAGLVPTPALQPIPDIILLMAGTNDMYSTTQPVAQAPTRLGALLDKIVAAAPNALLVVAQITPLQNSAWETQVVTYDAALPAVVAARASAGKHILLVDMHTGFQVSTMLSSDGIHPNQTGYNHMGDVWYAAIQSVLP
jgi:hypothetical protein